MGDRRNKKKQGTVDTTMEGDTENNTGDSVVDTVAIETRACAHNNPSKICCKPVSSLLLKQEELRVQADLEFKKREQVMEAECKNEKKQKNVNGGNEKKDAI